MDNTPSTLSQPALTAAMIQLGVKKHKDRYESLFFKAFLAGIYLSFGGLLYSIVNGGSTGLTQSNPALTRVLAAFTFPVGLVMIVLTGQELLTSNMMVMPMAAVNGAIPWWSIPVNWIIVTFGNLVGSLFFAAILVKYSGIVSAAPYPEAIKSFAIHKAATPEWHQIFLRGIGCNWLVCLAVWQAYGAKETISKIFAIWIPIWVFVACSFDHVVANMFSIPLGIMFGADLTVAEYIRKSFIAAYLGNIVGALLVGLPPLYFYMRGVNDIANAAEMGQATPGEFSTPSSSHEKADSSRSENLGR